MVKKTISVVFLLAWAWLLPALEKPGVDLLDGLVMQFQQMKERGRGGYTALDKSLQDLMAAAKSSCARKKIDPPFFRRYVRILQIIKLAIVTKDYDREGILNPLVQSEINRFVADVSGVEPDGKDIGIARLADAISNEIINLHLILDCQERRAELWKKFNGAEPGKK
jgi:hypothetical protein